MTHYIDAEKIIAFLKKEKAEHIIGGDYSDGVLDTCKNMLNFIDSLQQEQPNNMIRWTGNNLKEVIDFTGKSPRFGEWFKSWEEYENYVHTHNDVLKLFCEDGSYYKVPIGAWIVKTPDGYNVPSVAKYVQQEQPELPGYNKALLEVKSKVDKLYEETSIGLNEYDCGLYNGIAETCMKLRGFIKARLDPEEQPGVDLEKEINRYCGTRDIRPVPDFMDAVARHFAEWGATHLNAKNNANKGIELIANERQRQIKSEGYSIKHDLEHTVREMIHAAEAYATSADLSLHSETFEPDDNWHETNEPFYRKQVQLCWPWTKKSFKPTTPLRDLVKAGALIAAAIDRLNAKKEDK